MEFIARRTRFAVDGVGRISGVICPDLSFWLESRSASYQSTTGFIYILRNDHHSDYVYKIGRSERHPELRADELSRETSSPGRFHLVDFRPTDDASLAEWLIFSRLSSVRIGPVKEFVCCDLSEIVDVLEICAVETCHYKSVNYHINQHISLGKAYIDQYGDKVEL